MEQAPPIDTGVSTSARATSVEKALEVCEALAAVPNGLSLAQLSRVMSLPRPTVHRLLRLLRRRGYVLQESDTQRYSLSLKMLDLSFRLLGRSEIRLHAYPVLRDFVVRTGERTFVAIPVAGEVTYIWRAGPDEVGTQTAYGKEMPAHCAVFFDAKMARRRLSCLRTTVPADGARANPPVQRLGPPALADVQRLICTCAPVRDYSGREVARVGVFRHGTDDQPILGDENRAAWELAQRVSMRLGHLGAPTLGATA